jgi:hypothetical protein
MTWSAPIDRAVSTFAGLHTAVTSAPNDLAIWIANVPTPPDAPIDQNPLTSLDLPLIAKSLKGGDCRYWYGCRLLKRYIRRLACQSVFLVVGKPHLTLGEGIHGSLVVCRKGMVYEGTTVAAP